MIYTTITWACHGIWKSILDKILKEIAFDEKILVLDQDIEELKKLANNERIITYNINLENIEEIYTFQEWFLKNGFSCKHLVNNAWTQLAFDILKPDMIIRDKIFWINLKAPLLLSSFFAKIFINDTSNNHSIINITSIHDEKIREIAPYSCSKSALKMLTKEFAHQLAKYNIRVNAIAPWSIDTPMLRKDLYSEMLIQKSAQKIPLWRHWIGIDIANMVRFLQGNECSYITWATIVIDGWLSLVL